MNNPKIKQMIRYAYSLPSGSPKRKKIINQIRIAKKKIHQIQFEEADELSKVDKALAKVITMSGDGGADKIQAKPVPSMSASKLNPSQSELIVGKSVGQALAMLRGDPGMPIEGSIGAVISSDNHIMDGHHRWAARILARGKKAKAGGLKANLKGEELVRVLNILTKGGFGRDRGKSGKGNIKDFTPAKVKKALENAVKKGLPGKFPWTGKEVVKVLEDEFGSVEKGIKTMSANAAHINTNPPSWTVKRDQMPVIEEKELTKTQQYLDGGEIDWAPPYVKGASSDRELRKKLIRLAHQKPELRKQLLPLLKSAGEI